ncbi:HlyD family secretion protein [Bacteroidota bacterium]
MTDIQPPDRASETGVRDESEKSKEAQSAESGATKARTLTLIILAVCLLIFVWYVRADRFTPYTDQARLNSLTIPIVAQVSGYLSDVRVQLHSHVETGDTLFIVDRRKYQLAVSQAEANVDKAGQSVGVGTASVKAAAAQLGSAKARLDRSQRNFDRTQKVLNESPGALSQADRDRAETSLAQSVEGVATAEANLEKAKESLGAAGPDNADLRLAIVGLEQAQLNLAFSAVIASYRGVIESFNVDIGYYAAAGAPLATLVTDHDVWLQANFRENNITNLSVGDRVEVSLDVAPGRVFEGTLRSIGYGVNTGRSTNRGELPSVSSPSGWLRDPQRFPVIITMDHDETRGLLRVGGQADAIVYTGDHAILNAIGRLQIRLASWLSYVR